MTSEVFYKKALQYFAYALASDDAEQANKIFEEQEIKNLAQFIFDQKAKIPEWEFYFNAGRISQVLQDIYDCSELDEFKKGINQFLCSIQLNP